MGLNSKIEWTHHTFNPWRGCTKVSDGCKNCYADKLCMRNPKTLGVWGPSGTRVVAADSYWREPLKWNEAARVAGERHRVFCASLADVFEGPETMPDDSHIPIRRARLRLFGLIRQTPNLDWLLLTKRPENIMPLVERAALDCSAPSETCEMLNCWMRGNAPPNVWLGTSVENQKCADERIPHLLGCPAAVRFLSCEPLLEAIDFGIENLCREPNGDVHLRDEYPHRVGYGPAIDWMIVGGESGHRSRPCSIEWIRSIVWQCNAAGVACFVKQLGANPTCYYGVSGQVESGRMFASSESVVRDASGLTPMAEAGWHIKDSKGGDWTEWPADLRVREFPKVAEVAHA